MHAKQFIVCYYQFFLTVRYSMSVGVTQGTLVVAAGTIFSEILVWYPLISPEVGEAFLLI